MRIAVAADHAGYGLKEAVVRRLRAEGYDVTDFGTDSPESVDYPDFAGKVAEAVAAGRVDRGILVCYTGIGMSIAANKVRGVRAAVAFNTDAVRLTRAHNDANILTMGAHYTDEAAASEYVTVFLNTPFDGGRHARRVGKISALEVDSASGDECRSAS